MTHQVHQELHNLAIDTVLAVVEKNVAILWGAQSDTAKAAILKLGQLNDNMKTTRLLLTYILWFH